METFKLFKESKELRLNVDLGSAKFFTVHGILSVAGDLSVRTAELRVDDESNLPKDLRGDFPEIFVAMLSYCKRSNRKIKSLHFDGSVYYDFVQMSTKDKNVKEKGMHDAKSLVGLLKKEFAPLECIKEMGVYTIKQRVTSQTTHPHIPNHSAQARIVAQSVRKSI